MQREGKERAKKGKRDHLIGGSKGAVVTPQRKHTRTVAHTELNTHSQTHTQSHKHTHTHTQINRYTV